MDAFVIRKKAQIFQNDHFLLTFVCKEKELKHQIELNGGICIENFENNLKKQIFVLLDSNFKEEMLTNLPRNAILLKTKWINECIQAKSRIPFSTYQVSLSSSKRSMASSSSSSSNNSSSTTDLAIISPPRPLKKLKTDDVSIPQQTTISPRSTWKWESFNQESLWVLDTYDKEKKEMKDKSIQVAAFDLDGTLIVTKSGKKFSQDATDWRFFDRLNKLKSKLETLISQPDITTKIVIFSNQNGVTKGYATIDQIHTKVENILEQLQIPCSVYLSMKDDLMRKPRTGAWQMFMSRQRQIDFTKSFYCGDAAGRPKSGSLRVKDFASTDYKFALNIGIQFYTPEQFFLDSKQRLHCHPEVREIGFDPRSLFLCKHNANTHPSVLQLKQLVHSMHPGNGNEQQRMMIVLFGPPASGKSTLATTLFKDFTWIHQDTLKTLAKCKQKALEVLKEEKNQHVVVDSTNRSVQTRHEWIELSKKIAHVQVVCVHLDIEKPLCMHLNVYRGLTGGQKVPDVAIHTFYKSMEIPQVQEGFKQVIKLPFLLKEDMKEEEKKLLCSFLY